MEGWTAWELAQAQLTLRDERVQIDMAAALAAAHAQDLDVAVLAPLLAAIQQGALGGQLNRQEQH